MRQLSRSTGRIVRLLMFPSFVTTPHFSRASPIAFSQFPVSLRLMGTWICMSYRIAMMGFPAMWILSCQPATASQSRYSLLLTRPPLTLGAWIQSLFKLGGLETSKTSGGCAGWSDLISDATANK